MNVHGVYVVGRDPDRLADFYEKLLGIAPRFKVPQTWIQFRAGATNFSVSSVTEGSPGAVGATVIFEVADLDAAVDEATALGASFVQVRDMGSHGRTASVTDPEGNHVQFFQRAQEPKNG